MRYFPIFLDLNDQNVLIVGGGETALQKLRLLVKTQAHIFVVAPSFEIEIVELAKNEPHITLIERAFAPEDAENKRLVYGASEDEAVDQLAQDSAQKLNVLFNKVDTPKDCDFITPSLVDRDPITVAIGTEGTAPLLAREIKAKLDQWLPANLGALGRQAQRIRPLILERISQGRDRLRLWERLLHGPFRTAVLEGDEEKADQVFKDEIEQFEHSITQTNESSKPKGSVAFVGAGPGDPDLLTLKALHSLQGADVLVIDRLVNPQVLDYARRDATRIHVGKQAGGPSSTQEEINQILVREALSGARVVRVKGGDPNVFGRIQEELAACQLMGIDVEVVPGISAAQAASAAAQLPLTFRGKHRSITLITAATKDQIVSSDVMAFMKAGRPFAIYMGVKLAGEIVNSLHASGADMDTDVIIVENASRDNERLFAAPLKHLHEAVEAYEIKGPAILFVGLSYDDMGLMPAPKLEQFEASNVVPLNRQVS